jgi:hypothetical protein
MLVIGSSMPPNKKSLVARVRRTGIVLSAVGGVLIAGLILGIALLETDFLARGYPSSYMALGCILVTGPLAGTLVGAGLTYLLLNRLLLGSSTGTENGRR